MKINKLKNLLLYLTLVSSFIFSNQTAGQERISSLNSSNPSIVWKLKPEAEVNIDSVKIFNPGFNTGDWVNASVPGTVFGAYVDDGIEKDPNYGDNIYHVDKSRYNHNFWYRTEFIVPKDFVNDIIWLNFKGVNRDADIFLNGKYLGTIKGIMQRGRFNISNIITRVHQNVLAVLVHIPQAPISNGASPTYGSSEGWDWMPYVPGLNMGIQDDVYLSNTGPVSIADPWIKTELPDTSLADIKIRVELKNNSSSNQSGELTGIINPGNITFSSPVTIPAHETKEIYFDNNGFPQLSIEGPNLWWPNGYGAQNLYSCNLQFLIKNKESDKANINFGIRKLVVDTSGDIMKIEVNGEKIFAKGGNWGMPEYMLRCSDKDYDTRVKLHKDMNFNIIRNWMGSTTNDKFYEACDKYGIMVWDDFWLNSSGGMPRDINIFNANAVEKIKRLRNHPCIILWCGDNEGDPPPPLNDWLKADVKSFDGRHYHPNSHSYSLTGSGPWSPLDPAEYFTNAAPGHWGGTEGWGMRSEMGTAVFVNYDSFIKFIPEDKLWPENEMWDKHFFGESAKYAGPDVYVKDINNRYGTAAGIKDFCRKAQLLNIETNKAMFEGWLDNLWNDATGLIIWMSQSAYPSMVWQTYDYYYDATGAYWGAKKACEPIHIQWNPAVNTVKVINTTLHDLKNCTAEAEIYSIDGTQNKDLYKTTKIDIEEDSLKTCFTLIFPDVDLACNKKAFTSTVGVKGEEPVSMTDANEKTKWESDFGDQQWAYIDLGEMNPVNHVRLNWDNSCAKIYKIQLSLDSKNWKDVYYTSEGEPGIIDIKFKTADASFVRMYCIEKNTRYRVSLWSFQVYYDSQKSLSDLHFIKLQLKDSSGKLLADNFYWRGKKYLDYKDINKIPAVNLDVKYKISKKSGKYKIGAQISNPVSSPAIAFVVHLKVIKKSNGEPILPVFMNDNYFSLLKGETKNINIDFDESQLNGDEPELIAEPYNSESQN